MALVTVQRSPTPSTTSSPCASRAELGFLVQGGRFPVIVRKNL
ncbi:SSH2 isoform 12 [Pan troglodytes]|uniref:Slingshot protein phosphatase 2 n=8 Tax=Catarrhini TaxID=9526 RepID=K7EQZ0_HUMAN|nr:SSH2 isoform 12 [Pan troglodytes]PNJ34392.1 SSH2 isoform 12 [Pongo abelii]